MPILYEDPAVLAIDKPAGWLIAPEDWTHTRRNLQLALRTSIALGDFWARARHIKFLRFIHRLDADTSGVLLLAKSPGALRAYSRLFQERQIRKRYLAIVQGRASAPAWTCHLRLSDDSRQPGRVRVDPRHGQQAETRFRVLATSGDRILVEAQPITGRTHQIRVHLAAARLPVLGDSLYGPPALPPADRDRGLALRAIEIQFLDPFRRRPVTIAAPSDPFLKSWLPQLLPIGNISVDGLPKPRDITGRER